MLLFLEKDYLHEAVQQKRSLLSQCLLTVPRYSEFYSHRENLQNHESKYRSPWEKIQSDACFLHEEVLKIGVYTEVLTAGNLDVFHPEPFENDKSLNDSVTEFINFDLDSDVIPSSNPESPNLFLQDDPISEGSNILHEIFRKEDLPVFYTINENLKLEIFLSSVDEEKLPNRVPELTKLIGRLKPVVVSDPLQDEKGLPICEDNIFSSQAFVKFDEIQTFVEGPNLDIINDTFEKQQLLSDSKQTLDLEDVVTDNFELTKKEDIYYALNTTLNTDLKLLLPAEIKNDVNLTEEVTKRIIKNTKDVSADIVPYFAPYTDDKQITFLDINEPDFTDLDDICEEAFLDTPLLSSPVCYPDLEFPGCSPVELHLSEPVLLGQKEREHLKRICFSSELFCGEIYAYRLSDPYSFDVEEESKIDVKYIQQVSQLVKFDQLSTAPTDLQLAWDIAKISDIGKDPSHLFDKLKIDISEKPVCDPVETFERALPEEFNDLDNANEEYELESLDSQTENCFPSPINSAKKCDMEINNDHPKIYENSLEKANLQPVCMSVRQKFDPVENFIALRCKKNELAISNHQTERPTIVADELEKKQEQPPRELHEDQIKPSLNKVGMKGKKTKHLLVKVQLSDAYRSLLSNLERDASRYLSILKTNNGLPRSSTFQTLTPDVTRFLVKQREKHHADNNMQATDDDSYRNILCLHGLVGTAEILIKCSLESALGFLNAFQERYQNAVKNSLDVIHHSLLKSRERFKQLKIYHPKMTAMCKEIETWLRKKRVKSGDIEQKILVIVRKAIPSLKNCLKEVLNLSKLLHPQVLETTDANSLIESLDDHNCLIIQTNQIEKTFPWAQFSLVVEYEHQENLEWKDHYCKEFEGTFITEQSRELISLIASQYVTSNSALLQLLESRFNIQLYERDYSLFKLNKNLAFSDLDIDENTAIIIEDIGQLQEDKTLHYVVTRIVSLSLKYAVCHCLFYKDRKLSTGYPYSSHVISNLSKLQAAFVNFERRSKSNYNAKIILCQDVNEMAMTIRRICEERLFSSMEISMEEGLERSWLSTDITQEEKLLLQNPCMSSFNAQLLLKARRLKDLKTASLDELAKAAPGIARTTLLALCERIQNIPAISDVRPTKQVTEKQDPEITGSETSNSTLRRQTTEIKVSHNEKETNPDICPLVKLLDKEMYRPGDKLNSYRQNSFVRNDDVLNDSCIKSSTETESRKMIRSVSKYEKYLSNEKDTPMSCKQDHHKQNSSKSMDIFEQTLTEKPTRQQGVMNMNQLIKTSMPAKKARRHLEFEHIGMTEVERSFRQKYGSGRTPQKSDTRQGHQSDGNLQRQDIRHQSEDIDILNFNPKQDFDEVNFSLNLNENSSCSDERHQKLQRGTGCTVDPNLHSSQEFYGTYDDEKENNIIGTGKSFVQPFVKQTSSFYQDMVGQPVQTFDYNHGIPKQAEVNFQRNVHHCLQENDRSSIQTPPWRRALDSMIAFDKEYPPSIEIDRLISHSNCLNPESVKGLDVLQGYPTCTGLDYPKVDTANETYYNKIQSLSNSGYDQSTHLHVNSNIGNQGRHSVETRELSRYHSRPEPFSSSYNIPFKQHNSLNPGPFLSELSDSSLESRKEVRGSPCDLQQNFSNLHFLDQVTKFPHITTHANTERENMKRNKTFFNPNMERLSLRPAFTAPAETETNTDSFYNSYADKSQEAFWKLLHTKFGSSANRYPIQKRSIGLAQPLQRPRAVEDNKIGQNNNQSMENGNQIGQYSKQTGQDSCQKRQDINQTRQNGNQTMQGGNVMMQDGNQIRPFINRTMQDGKQTRQDSNQTRQYCNQPMQNSDQEITAAVQTRQDDTLAAMDVHQMNQSKRVDDSRNYLHITKECMQTKREATKSIPLWSAEEKRKMLQSPWATESSPPMDLDYEDSQINMVLHPNHKPQELANRSVFTGATPDKKRRLSYERVPGKKGQTKLTFH